MEMFENSEILGLDAGIGSAERMMGKMLADVPLDRKIGGHGNYFPEGLPSPPFDLFSGGVCCAIFARSCSRRVFDVDRPSATLYSIVPVFPSPVGSLPLRMCSPVRRARLLVSPIYVILPELSRIRYSPA